MLSNTLQSFALSPTSIHYPFLCSSKEKDEKKGRPGKAFFLAHWPCFGNFRTRLPAAGSHRLKFFFLNTAAHSGLFRGLCLHQIGVVTINRPYTMPCEEMTSNARKRSRRKATSAFQWAGEPSRKTHCVGRNGSFFFHILFEPDKENMVASCGREILCKKCWNN